jgi:thiol-disulfide isomerase/thioredoxin
MGGVSRWINRISGAVVIALGLNIIFDFFKFLNYEKRLRLTKRPAGIIGAFAAGAAFGAGWTPCVGPVLAGILLLAAQSGGIPRAALYLAFYSAGLGLPFLLTSLFFSAFAKTHVMLRPHLPLIRKISGALLVAIGVLMCTGRYQALNALAAQWQNRLTGGGAAALPARNTAPKAAAVESPPEAPPSRAAAAFQAAGLPFAAKGIAPVDCTLPLLDGTRQTLSALKGSVVFLNFWAAWCGPCRMEMPSMEQVYQRLKDRGFTILAVNSGESADAVSGFMQENTFTFPVALDETGTVSYQYAVQAIPATYIIDRRGLIVSRVVGAIDWNQPAIIAAFERLLDERE